MSQELEKINEQEQALVAATQDDLGDDELVIPILKVCQPLTAEVGTGDAVPGDLLNSLTGIARTTAKAS